MNQKRKGLASLLCLAMLLTGCSGGTQQGGAYAEYVTPGDYKGIPLEPIPTEVTDEEVDSYIDYVLAQSSDYERITDRVIAVGDTVNINYRGLLNGVAFEGGTAENQSLTIGSGQFIEGFEEGLVGFMPDIQVDLNLTFPEAYHAADLAGQAVVFEVFINYIYGDMVTPELTDDWVQEQSGYATLEEFRAGLKEEMLLSAQQNAEAANRGLLIETVVANATVKGFPQEWLDREMEEQMEYFAEFAASMGVTLDEMLSMTGMNQEQLEEDSREYITQMMVLTEIAHREGIALTEQDKTDFATEYGFASYQEFTDTYGEQKVEEALLAVKVEDFLLENAAFQ